MKRLQVKSLRVNFVCVGGEKSVCEMSLGENIWLNSHWVKSTWVRSIHMGKRLWAKSLWLKSLWV